MKTRIFMSCALLISAAIFAGEPSASHQTQGSGVDSELFLNPYLESELKNLSDHLVLDAGTCYASRAILAAKQGAKVYAVESQQDRLALVREAVHAAGLESHVSCFNENFEQLPFEANTFDRAVCVHIGTSLPATMRIVMFDQSKVTGLGAHLSEVARVMKDEGYGIIAAPASYGVVFTKSNCDAKALSEHIEQVLEKVGDSEDPNFITQCLEELNEVNRATFVRRNGMMQLVTNERELRIGEQVWCKVPEGVSSSYYHSEEEYLVALKNAGLHCEEIKRPCFFGNVRYNLWREAQPEKAQALGEAYITHNPFTIYYVVKRA